MVSSKNFLPMCWTFDVYTKLWSLLVFCLLVSVFKLLALISFYIRFIGCLLYVYNYFLRAGSFTGSWLPFLSLSVLCVYLSVVLFSNLAIFVKGECYLDSSSLIGVKVLFRLILVYFFRTCDKTDFWSLNVSVAFE